MAKKAAAESDAPAPGETITKTEAVKRALAAGKDMPADGVAYIKETFGIEMTTQQFSTNKFQLKNKTGAPRGKPGRKPKTAVLAAPAAPAGGSTVENGRATGNAADLARAVKALVQQHGAADVVAMAKVFE